MLPIKARSVIYIRVSNFVTLSVQALEKVENRTEALKN